jgi:hypothetical protein
MVNANLPEIKDQAAPAASAGMCVKGDKGEERKTEVKGRRRKERRRE